MSNRWVISDNHWNHSHIILYENRPFETVNEMNNYMIEKWNKIVSKSDNIFHLGDFGIGNKDFIKNLIAQLNGDIFLILGNHDRSKSDSWWIDVGIKSIYRYPIIIDQFFMLSHEPMYLNKNMPYINLHGHTHGLSYNSSQYINCSVENYNYEPQNLDKILYKYKNINQWLNEE